MNIETDNEDPTDKSVDFKLLKHFTLTALVSIAVAAVLLGNLYQRTSQTQFLDGAKQHHQEITRLYKNFIWPNYGEFLLQINDSTVEEMPNTLLYKALHSEIEREIHESRVLKLKIFNQQGLTVYSSDPAQVGQIKKGYPGFESAMSGTVISDVSFRKTFDSGVHGEKVADKHVYSSYIPVFNKVSSNEVIAVMELYSDITNLVDSANADRINQFSATVIVMLALFVVLLFNVKRADSRIKEQDRIQKKMKDEAYWRANHDALTGLANRNYFSDQLSENLKSIEDTDQMIALMFIDLDFFKPINDVHGHRTGDLVLQEVAKRIQITLPSDAVVARQGGDEFTAFFKANKTGTDASSYANDVLEAISLPYHFDEIECFLSASIGITGCQNPDIDTDVLIAEADSAMYLSKRAGHGKANVYLESFKESAA